MDASADWVSSDQSYLGITTTTEHKCSPVEVFKHKSKCVNWKQFLATAQLKTDNSQGGQLRKNPTFLGQLSFNLFINESFKKGMGREWKRMDKIALN